MSHELPEPIVEALAGGSCLRLVLSRRRKGAGAGAEAGVDKVTLRPVRIGESAGDQLAVRLGSKESHENLTPGAAVERVRELFGETFLDCHCFTPEADWTARVKKGARLQLLRRQPTKSAEVPTEHDRGKQYLLPEGEPIPFLVAIGVMTEGGRVRKARYAKFRQINRFLELVGDVLAGLPAGPLHVVDYGCGKSYLTFGLYHLLVNLRGREVTITGLDLQEDVIAHCNRIAADLGWQGLTFRVGHIAEHQPGRDVDLAVSLHACDTASDDALAQAVSWNARAILAAPCCQHELLHRIHNEALAPLESHGLLKERFASLATDTLRAAALEAAGYRTQVVEFASLEHTAKNLLLRAVRRPGEDGERARRREEYEAFKRFLGLESFRLDGITS